jgi:predicted dehydrogenase
MADAIQMASNARLTAIASRDFDRARNWIENNSTGQFSREPFGTIQPHGCYEALIRDAQVDIVYVALPPSLHCEWAIAALENGKDVLCEKPLCMDYREACLIRNAAAASGRRILDATAYPFHPRSSAAREAIQSGGLGDIRRVHVACTFNEIFRREADHRTDSGLGGGCLLDLGWYCVHATLWMTGLSCKAVKAMGQKRDGVWCQVQVLAELSNRAVAHWDCGFDAAGRKWMEVAGSDGSWICDDLPRPFNLAQPRYWIHGDAGKVRAEVHGVDVFQEAKLIEWFSEGHNSDDSVSLAVECQRILGRIENSLLRPSETEI